MSELYSIKDSTLTALGDAVRSKVGVKYISVDEMPMEPFFTATIDTSVMEKSYTDNYDMYEVLIDYKTLLGDKYDITKRIYATYNYELTNKFCFSGIRGRSTEIYQGSSSSNSHPFFDRPTELVGSGALFGRKLTHPYVYFYLGAGDGHYKVSISLWACDANDKFIVLNKYTPLEMADAINGIDTKPPLQDIVIDVNGTYSADEGYYGIGSVEVNTMSVPDEALNLTGNCQYRFAYGGSDWLINLAGNKITTKNISSANYMFQGSKVEYIPFEINMTGTGITSMFEDCANLKEVPVVNIPSPKSPIDFNYNFRYCYSIREVPEWFCNLLEQSYNSGKAGAFGPFEYVFQNCLSLRKMPEKVMKYMAINGTVSGGNYYTMVYGKPFQGCASLDELVGISCDDYNFTSNQFTSFFTNLSRVKDITFATNEDGTPMVRGWKSQTLELQGSGFCVNNETSILNYNSGITADKKVTDDATYQALKNDPDWYSTDANYSRYNHNSAVNTINSLPDCSSSGGTNTIKFKGEAGALTDGGAINTLTEEEIAVATAKGWVVSYV